MIKSTIYLLLLLSFSLSAKVHLLDKASHRAHPLQAGKYELSMFYCGFGQDYCGQSDDDDVNKLASYVILAFVDTNPDGSVTMDEDNFPSTPFKQWKTQGKKVLISVGGQNGNWGFIFQSQQNTNNFVESIKSIISKWNLDGVDIDI